MQPTIFPSLAVPLAEHLRAGLAARGVNIPVVVNVPSTRPPKFVRIRRIGGGDLNLRTDEARMVAECWETTGALSESLAAIVRALLVASAPGYVGSVWLDRARCVGFTDSPDPGTNLPRHLVTVELLAAGVPLT